MAQGRWGRIEYLFLEVFRSVKRVVTGSHPHTNVLHPQWVMDSSLLSFAKTRLSDLPPGSLVLDVGCGNAPYWHLNTSVDWIGLDIDASGKAHYVLDMDSEFPIPSNHVDFILSTQVLEHVKNYELMVSEMWRTLKPGGVVFLNVPYLFPLHGLPHDYQRFTPTKLQALFSEFEIVEFGSIGGIGSSLATLLNNFWNDWSSTGIAQQLAGMALWPLSLLKNLLLNLLAKPIDKFDTTGRYAMNFFLVARKPVQR